MGNNQWVVPTSDGRWAQKAEGAARATKIFATQKEAIAKYSPPKKRQSQPHAKLRVINDQN